MSVASNLDGLDRAALHDLLWRAALGARPGEAIGAWSEACTADRALAVLRAHAHAFGRGPLLFGAWSLVQHESAVSAGALSDVLVSVLGFDLDVARRLAQRRPLDALPPEPGQRILESSCRTEVRGEWIGATVDALFHESMDRLSWMADPRAWEAHGPLWHGLRIDGAAGASRDDAAGCRRLAGTLWLPCVGPVALSLDADTSAGALELRTDFATRDDEPGRATAIAFSGFLRLSKERGRPGTTRIENQRVARFTDARATPLAERLLAYWLRLETFCLLVATP